MPFSKYRRTRSSSSPPVPDGSESGSRAPSSRLLVRLAPLALLLPATWLIFLIRYGYPIFPYLIVAILVASLWRLRAGIVALPAALALLALNIVHVSAHPWRDGWDDLLVLTLLGLVFLGSRAILDGQERQRQREQRLIAELSEVVAQLRESERQQRAAHEQLLRSARLAALGQFSATMAHELRNPLNVVKLSIHYVSTRLPSPDEKLQRNLGHMNRSVDRACRIIEDLLAFSRLPPPQLQPAPINEVVREAVMALEMPPLVTVEWSLAPDLPPVLADPYQIEQAVGNLGLNALQAMPEGGCLRISTSREAEQVAIRLHDTGPGIPEELRERVFEPFFSTKASGTGLGLPLVREIALAHGGTVSLRSGSGEGACFTLTLPLAIEQPSPGVFSPGRPTPAGGWEEPAASPG